MSDRAMQNHEAFAYQLQDIYLADGANNPFLALAFRRMILVSYWAAICAPVPGRKT